MGSNKEKPKIDNLRKGLIQSKIEYSESLNLYDVKNDIKKIEKLNDNAKFLIDQCYRQVEMDRALLNEFIQERLTQNLKESSKRQRQLTWSIIIIGGLNLVLAILKLTNII